MKCRWLMLAFVSANLFAVDPCVEDLLRKDPHTLFRLNVRSSEVEQVFPVSNFLFRPTGNGFEPRTNNMAIVRATLRRTPEQFQELERLLTDAHGVTENSFARRGATGISNEFFVPTVHPVLIPLSEQGIGRLAQSTAPMNRANRKLLQVWYSNANPTLQDFGFLPMPQATAEHFWKVLRSSIYFEPAFRAPQMAEYPFLTLTGFDSAISDPEWPEPVFYEQNTANASGLSNATQHLDALRQVDRSYFQPIQDRLPHDDTFPKMRAAAESNGLAWTRNPHGITVVVTPGEYNGAHPDVAYSAVFMGLPLVRRQDVYQDAQGYIRLNVGHFANDPVVTTIIPRTEETYFFNDPAGRIPARSPSYVDLNRRLSQRLGIPLEEAVIYDYVYDGNREAVDVRRGPAGEPLYQEIFGGMGVDPSRPGAPRGSFLQAVLDRKLYYANLGGGVTSNKALFAILSKYLAPQFVREGESPDLIARPPRTLELAEYGELYAASDRSKFVIKPLDQSGGNVWILAQMTQAEANALIERVKAHPASYQVEEVVPGAGTLVFERGPDGAWALQIRKIEVRIYTFMDAEGNVSWGPRGILTRVAPPGSLISNNGAGGTYGLGVVLSERTIDHSEDQSFLPNPPPPTVLPVDRARELRQYLVKLLDLREQAASSRQLRIDATMANDLVFRQRSIMDLLGRNTAFLMTAIRKFSAGEISQTDFHRRLSTAIERLKENEGLNPAVAVIVTNILGGILPEGPLALEDVREAVKQYLGRLGVPFLMKRDRAGHVVPVALANTVDVDLLLPLLRESMGFEIALQPTHRYDHGYLRVGTTLIDRDSPGQRGFGEIHSSGISWFDVPTHLQFNSHTRIEPAYFVTPAQREAAEYYHRIRRSGLYQLQYSMGGELPSDAHTLSTSEHCFTFSYAHSVEPSLNELVAKLRELGVRDVGQFTQIPAVRDFLAEVRATVLGLPVFHQTDRDAMVLTPNLLEQYPLLNERILNAIATQARIQDRPTQHLLLRWLVAYESTREYGELLRALQPQFGVDTSGAIDVNVPFVLVFDTRPEAYREFMSGTYSASGRRGGWVAAEQIPVRYSAGGE